MQYTHKYANWFVLEKLEFGWICLIYLPLSFKEASKLLGQSYDCTSAIDVTLKYLGKSNHSKTELIVCIP